MHWAGWHMGWMWILWILIIIVLVLSIGWIIISTRGGNASPESPEQILKKRYAQGEIKKEEFEQKLKDLRQD